MGQLNICRIRTNLKLFPALHRIQTRKLRIVIACFLLSTCPIGQFACAQESRPDEPITASFSDLPVTDEDLKASKLATSNDELAKRVEALEAEIKKSTEESEKAQKKASASPTFKIGGQLAIDSLWFSQSAASRQAVGDVQDSFDFRRARLYAQGEYEKFSYVTGFDFAQGTASNGRPTFLDNYIGVREVPVVQNFRIGHFFEPFTLERSSSNRNSTFMERSLADAFAPSRNLGVMIFGENESKTVNWMLGSFRSDTDNFGDDSGDQEGQSADARLVYRPYYDEESDGRYMLHVGGAYVFRSSADHTVQYRSRPEAFGNADLVNPATPFFVDTGSLSSTHSQLAGAELFLVHGPCAIQSEFVFAPVATDPGPGVTFSGGYFNTSIFITGEHRRYNRTSATLDRVIPNKNFSPGWLWGEAAGGNGAWEIAARFSYIDLTDGPVEGGELNDLTFGINWYLTPYHRFKSNYVHAKLDRSQQVTLTHIFGLRFDMDF